MRLVFFALCFLPAFASLFPVLQAQDKFVIKGRVITSDQQPLQNATITLKDTASGVIIAFAISKADGRFLLQKEDLQEGDYLLVIEHLNANTEARKIQFKKANPIQPDYIFLLQPVARQLKEVIIKGVPPAFSIRGDTVEFKAKAYKTAETRKVQDLIKNMQGFELGSDGRISFNGKEVDRILIEGEDLTEKNYRLLSRNLNASMVDKVQVIHNFSSERLLKEVENSDKIGINLTIDEKFRNKLSGTAEAGAGIGKREYLDNNLVWLTKKIKLLFFLNYNETGMPVHENLQYYFNQDEAESSDLSGNQDAGGLLHTGQIFLPPLAESYTRDNEDITSFVLGSWKAGNDIKIKALTGTGRSRLQNRADGSSRFMPADGNDWELLMDERYQSSLSENILKLSVVHDQQKDNSGIFTLDVLKSYSRNRYNNLASGAITDTLDEELNGKGWLYRFEGNETFKLRKGRILKTSLIMNREDIVQDFQSETNRYQDFFMLDSAFQFFSQQLKGILSKQEIDMTLLGRSGLYSWFTGFRILRENSAYDACSKAIVPETEKTEMLGLPKSMYKSFRAGFYSMLSRKLHKKGELTSALSLGMGQVEIKQDNLTDHYIKPVFRGMIGYRYAPSALKNIILQYNVNYQVAERLFFHPDFLLSGQATIVNPAEQLIHRRNHVISFTYASHNLVKVSGLFLNASYSQTDGSYAYSSTIAPSYTLLYYLPQNGNRLLTGNMKIDKYVSRVRTKLSVQFSSVFAANDLYFNGIFSRNKMANLSILPKFVTAFRGPVNGELSVTAMYIRNSTLPDSGLSSHFTQWQYQGYGKLKIRAGKNVYMAILYNYYVLSPGNFFQTMDCFANFQLNKSWTILLTGHNLFNASTIEQRQFAVNSISMQRYGLVERYLMMKCQWSF